MHFNHGRIYQELSKQNAHVLMRISPGSVGLMLCFKSFTFSLRLLNPLSKVLGYKEYVKVSGRQWQFPVGNVCNGKRGVHFPIPFLLHAHCLLNNLNYFLIS